MLTKMIAKDLAALMVTENKLHEPFSHPTF